MPSSNPLSIFYESLNPTTASADALKEQQHQNSHENGLDIIMKEDSTKLSKHENVNNINSNLGPLTSLDNHPAQLVSPNNNNSNVIGGDKNSTTRVLNDKIKSHVVSTTSDLFPLHYIVDMDVVKEVVTTLAFTVWGLLTAFVLFLIPRRFRYKDVTGQIVLVTGAGSGIGRLMSKKLALEHGATIVVWDINKQGAEETVKQIKAGGGKAYSYVVDVSNKDKIYEAAEKVQAEVGKVDILINNAGIVSGSSFLSTPDTQIEKTFLVNSLSNFWTTKKFLPAMLKDGRGHIVTIASTAGLVGVNRLVDYCASKYAAVGFHEALVSEVKAEMGCEGIATTLVCPYYINTGMFDGVKSKLIPILQPDDVVNDVVAGILTNQETVVIPRYIIFLVVAKYFIPANVGLKIQTALGVTGTMLGFKGRH